MNADFGRAGAWWTFLRERAPLPVVLAIGGVQSLSSFYLFRTGFDVAAVGLGALGIAGVLVLLRLMDEVKDFQKDLVAHAERPLPRGLLRTEHARRAIGVLGAALVAFAALLAVTRGARAGVIYAAIVGYTWLMYREFFASRALQRNTFVYALTHQVVVIPTYAFTVSLASAGDAFSASTLWFALTGLGASFTYEIARKLDPTAHPILATYLQLHGRGRVVAAILAALALLVLSAQRLGVQAIVWPFIALVLATLPVVYLRPARHRMVAHAAEALVAAQLLAPTLRHAWEVLS